MTKDGGIIIMDVAKMITDKIIEELEKGNIPWQKPWLVPSTASRVGTAYSRSTGKPYSLLNQMLLGKTGEWATFNQIVEAGGKVKKGEKGSVCVFWKFLEKKTTDDETGEEVINKIPMLRYYTVFHIATQCEGIEPKYNDKVETAEEVAKTELEKTFTDYYNREGIDFQSGLSDRAYYSPTFDQIVIPDKSQFTDNAEYISTQAHETVHSTGHKNRLARDFGKSFGNELYSKEELVAEIGASMLLNMHHIETKSSFTNSVAYIGSWLKHLKDDKNLIISASSKADKAVQFILTGEGE